MSLLFNVSVSPYTRFKDLPRELVKVARTADRLGFHAIGLPEHMLPPASPSAIQEHDLWPDPFELAVHLGAHTERLRFQSQATVIPYHEPIHFAKQLATADLLTGGRVILGAGSGWLEAEFGNLGLAFAERAAITDEYLRVMKVLWTEDRPAFAGRYVSFEDATFHPKPVQPGGIPILIAGSGPGPLHRVAELGDGWVPMTADPAVIADGLARIRSYMADACREADLMICSSRYSVGFDAETERMREHVTGAGVAAAAPPAEKAIADLERLRIAGCTAVTVGFAWRDADDLCEDLERFADNVMPAFAAAPR